MKHELPKLPYGMDALAPVLSREALEFHHDKHHRNYVDTLNKLIVGTPFQDATLEETVMYSGGPIFNNSAQAWNHGFFWQCLQPPAETAREKSMDSELRRALERDFGSIDGFKKAFAEAGKLFGSGWVWLALDRQAQGGKGTLRIEALSNADNPVRKGLEPIFTCDVWEHAYYIDYRNARAKYVEAFWQILNWDFAARCLSGESRFSLPARLAA